MSSRDSLVTQRLPMPVRHYYDWLKIASTLLLTFRPPTSLPPFHPPLQFGSSPFPPLPPADYDLLRVSTAELSSGPLAINSCYW